MIKKIVIKSDTCIQKSIWTLDVMGHQNRKKPPKNKIFKLLGLLGQVISDFGIGFGLLGFNPT
jgi:hypothetical protein